MDEFGKTSKTNPQGKGERIAPKVSMIANKGKAKVVDSVVLKPVTVWKGNMKVANPSFKKGSEGLGDTSMAGANRDRRLKTRVDQISQQKNVHQIRTRAPPLSLYQFVKTLSDKQKESLRDLGFGFMEKFEISEIPTKLGLRVVENFDHVGCTLNIDGEKIPITSHAIYDVLGVPMGEKKINALRATRMNDVVTKEWRVQFPKTQKRIYPSHVYEIMEKQTNGGKLFKLNFLVLYITIMAESIKCGTVNQKFLPCITKIGDVKNMDWCSYILDCLKRTRASWNRNSHFNGPLIFLVLFYANMMKAKTPPSTEFMPVFRMWKSYELFEFENIDVNEDGTVIEDSFVDDDKETDEQDEMTLQQLMDRKVMLKASKRKVGSKAILMKKKAKNYVDVRTSEVQVIGATEVDASKSKIESEGVFHKSEDAVPKRTKEEYMKLIGENLCIISDLAKVMGDVIDHAISDYPDADEFRKFKVMLSNYKLPDKINEEMVDIGGKQALGKFVGLDDINNNNLLQDTQFFNSPTIMKSIELNERSCYANVTGKTLFKLDDGGRDNNEIYGAPISESEKTQTNSGDYHVISDIGDSFADTQFFESPSVIKELEDAAKSISATSMGNRSSIREINDNNIRLTFDGPSFDLGISQNTFISADHIDPNNENEQMSVRVKENEMIVTPTTLKSDVLSVSNNAIGGNHECSLNRKRNFEAVVRTVDVPIDAVPISMCKPEIRKKFVRRVRKPTIYMLSPYVSRTVSFSGNVALVEKRISDCIFAARLPPQDIIFKTKYVECERAGVETMIPGVFIASGVLDAWCVLLNFDERLRNPNKVSRLFCNTSMVNDAMFLKNEDLERLYREFNVKIKNEVENSGFNNIVDIDLVFFPIICKDHVYVICYNLMVQQLHIIDNLQSKVDNVHKRYGKLPVLLTSLFVRYLSEMNHPRAVKMIDPGMKIIKMSWTTSSNIVDCGVFAMRHMEMYKGDGTLGFDSGFSKESAGQKKQIDELRVKYLAKVLLSEINMNKEKVIQEYQDYDKLPSFEKEKLKSDALVRIEERQKITTK